MGAKIQTSSSHQIKRLWGCVHPEQEVVFSNPHKCILLAYDSDKDMAKQLVYIIPSSLTITTPPPPTMGHGKHLQPDALGQVLAWR